MDLFCSPSYPLLRTSLLWCCIHVILFCWMELQQAHGCLESERNGLLKLKDQFNRPNGSSSLPSWDLAVHVDCCQWEQLSCDPFTNRVVGIHLNDLPFSMPFRNSSWFLDASIFLPFEDLQILNLGDTLLKGLEELPRLGRLELLDLSNNGLTTMPSVRGLTSLKILNLNSNHLSDCDGLTELTTLNKLEVLNLGGNDFNGRTPSFIGELTSLKSLSLSGSFARANQITGSLPAEVICRLKSLEELDLSGNQLQGNLPLCLSELAFLRVLNLNDNSLQGSIPASLFTSLNSLEYVSLSSNSFEGVFQFSSLANNPNLDIFELINNHNSLEVDIESPPGWIPLFQLKSLRLSNCLINHIPSFLLMQHQLRVLYLDNTGIQGNVLSWLLGNNTSLEFVSLSNNSLHGTIDLNPSFYNPNLYWLDVSSNLIAGELPLFTGSAMPNLSYLNMSGNALRGPIPLSIGEMRHLITLDLSNNYLSGEVPASLAINCFDLQYLKLSNNSFQGRFPPLTSSLKALSALHLDSNNLTGFTEGLLKSAELSFFNASHNALSGRIPNWIGNLRSLSSLILSNNFLQGPVPIGFCNMSHLKYSDLSHNNLGPTLPPCSNLSSLVHFHMHNNQLMGPIPNVLSQAQSLVTLDLSHNKLYGGIPSWFNASFPHLKIILLKGNTLDGPIPSSLCELEKINIIDFSNNSLSGLLPSCLGDLLLGREPLFDVKLWDSGPGSYTILSTYSHTNQLNLSPGLNSDYYNLDENVLVQFVTKKREETFEGNVLYYMSGLDLSCNKLEGPISPAIGSLSGLHALNLSHNYLNGSIPHSFSDLEQIESLDLSHNMLSGEIPTQLLGLNFLSVFSVAYNNLSGMTPKMVGQFSTFDASSYEGNPGLHGPPLNNQESCHSHDNVDCHTHSSNGGDVGDFGRSDQDYFWYSFAGSSVMLFFSVCGYFYLNSYLLDTILGFISTRLSMVPYCAEFAKLVEVRRNARCIRFVLDRPHESGATDLKVNSSCWYRFFKSPRSTRQIEPFPVASLQLT